MCNQPSAHPYLRTARKMWLTRVGANALAHEVRAGGFERSFDAETFDEYSLKELRTALARLVQVRRFLNGNLSRYLSAPSHCE
jgi:hypothetical protein